MSSTNNYIRKNLKTLRATTGLTLGQFGELFDLSKGNIASYESNTSISTDKYLQIMKHFHLDPIRFAEFDMTLHNVYESKNDSGLTENVKYQDLSEFIAESKQYKYLDESPPSTILKLCKNLLRYKEEVTKELLDGKNQIIDLQKENIELRKNVKQLKD